MSPTIVIPETLPEITENQSPPTDDDPPRYPTIHQDDAEPDTTTGG
jgi:hypothetical protein